MVSMASNNSVLFKKLEELEAQVKTQLQTPVQLPLNNLKIYQIQRKVDFIKTLLAAETESSSRNSNKHHDLQEIEDRLSVIENNFINWTALGLAQREEEEPMVPEEIAERLSFIENNFDEFDSSETGDETVDGPMPPMICERCQEEEEGEEGEGSKEMDFGVSEEKIREELEAIVAMVDIEKIVEELMIKKAKEKERKRGGRWLTRLGTMGVAAVLAAVGMAIAGFGSVEESVYLVPT